MCILAFDRGCAPDVKSHCVMSAEVRSVGGDLLAQGERRVGGSYNGVWEVQKLAGGKPVRVTHYTSEPVHTPPPFHQAAGSPEACRGPNRRQLLRPSRCY